MAKKIIVMMGSPKRDGNTATIIKWFCDGVKRTGSTVDVVETAFLKNKTPGCSSCRLCQRSDKYECVIKDEVSQAIAKVPHYDIIVFATPLYFFSASAQTKVVLDRFFSLYKWDNTVNTFTSPLKGKTLVLIADAYEDVGLKELEAPFKLTADYTDMRFKSLLIPNAGESGDIVKKMGEREKVVEFGENVCV